MAKYDDIGIIGQFWGMFCRMFYQFLSSLHVCMKSVQRFPKAKHEPDVTLLVISDVCLVLYTLELSLGCWRRKVAQNGLKSL